MAMARLGTPPLALVRPQWGFPGDLAQLCASARAGGFDAVEAQIPADQTAMRELGSLLDDHDLGLVVEVATGDWWVAGAQRSMADHLGDVARALDGAARLGAWKVSAMAGYDAWPVSRSVEFLGRAIELARERALPLAVETHRSRSLSTPWACADILAQLPQLELTCDFSHWVVVTERLLDGCETAVALAASHCRHIHARLGHEQGPQVPDPASPRWQRQLAAFDAWWLACFDAMAARDLPRITCNPEFGTDGYQTGDPAAETAALEHSVTWMAGHLRDLWRRWAAARSGQLPLAG